MIKIAKKDITTTEADVIVNAANSYLMHKGGVALAIAKKAGPIIDEQSRKIIEQHGKLRVTEVAVTSAGNLKAKYIIHAVGPKGTKPQLLEKTLTNVFEKAIELNARKIAIPPISCGTFGFDKKIGAKILINVAKKYEKHFEEILIASIDEEIITYLRKEQKMQQGN